MFVFMQNGISSEVSICSQSFQTKASFVEMLYFPAPSSTVKHSLNDTSI